MRKIAGSTWGSNNSKEISSLLVKLLSGLSSGMGMEEEPRLLKGLSEPIFYFGYTVTGITEGQISKTPKD